MEEPVEAELVQGNVIVWNVEQGRRLYKMGFYGRPLGISKPRSADFDVPLVLDIIEAAYLVEKGVMKIRRDGGEISVDDFFREAEKHYERFRERYLVYKDLRERGFVVTPGIKFGSDFAVYRFGPGLEHAPFIVQVKSRDESLSALEIIRSGRLATTVRKYFTLAVPDVEAGRVSYILFEWWRA